MCIAFVIINHCTWGCVRTRNVIQSNKIGIRIMNDNRYIIPASSLLITYAVNSPCARKSYERALFSRQGIMVIFTVIRLHAPSSSLRVCASGQRCVFQPFSARGWGGRKKCHYRFFHVVPGARAHSSFFSPVTGTLPVTTPHHH